MSKRRRLIEERFLSVVYGLLQSLISDKRSLDVLIDFLDGKDILDICDERKISVSAANNAINRSIKKGIRRLQYDNYAKIDRLFELERQVNALNRYIKKLESDFNIKRNSPVSFECIYIEDIELSVRAYNALKGSKCNTLADILRLSRNDLMKIKGIGHRTLSEINHTIELYGIYLE